ncbi:gtpase-activating protein gyp3 [Stemphylium lycopersici]|uniref:Gtpase-activating protein gyp3 n=1 Tax=Stemphylium lycopersici TaxID=183478 RepID=A0A364NG13_STELY|nr:gtpase-activating protein gyp3 [Stemphylium lycopersici]
MGDTLLRLATGVPHAAHAKQSSETAGASHSHYSPYPPSATEYTPPASPQPQLPYAARKGFGSLRSRHPAQLQMDTVATHPPDRPVHSPSPADSPTLPLAALPSPNFPQRQRAPSLLRHAAVPAPRHGASTNTSQRPMSPTMAPAIPCQDSSPRSPDLRAIFNPLASNPVNSNGPAWDSSTEDLSGTPTSPFRARGVTSSQHSFHPPLRSVTSIPDYAQYRGNERANLSGTYKPNRGVPNWSHTDYYPPPPRPFRGEEPRASFRSGWTNASSSIMETSGTERSSILTTRSSIASDRQSGVYSREQSRDRLRDRDDSPETILSSEIAEEEEQLDAVSDVLDSYFYDEDDEERSPIVEREERDFHSPSPAGLDSEPPELSQTPSHDFDSLDSFQSAENLKRWDERPHSHVEEDSSEISAERKRQLTIRPTSGSDFDDDEHSTESVERKALQVQYLPAVEVSPLHAPYTPRTIEAAVQHSKKRQSGTMKRSSEEIPRRVSVTLQALSLRTTETTNRPSSGIIKGHHPRHSNASRSHLDHIRRDISGLPQLPTSRARLSRQDWANIEAYSNRHSKRPSRSRTFSHDSNASNTGPQSPPAQRSQPLPELDEDEAIPRRASTSVFDRKSALFDLGMMAKLTTAKSKPETVHSAGLAPPEQSIPTVTPGLKKTTAPVERDRYGFKKASEKINVQEYNAWATKYEEHISRRRGKWVSLMSKQGLSTIEPTKFPEMSEKVKRYARKGYPPEWRGAMWWYYSGGQHILAQKENVGLYKSLVARVNRDELNKDDKDAIERDLDRTFPDNIHFRPEPATDLLDGESDDEPVLIQDLREVLSCFALNNPNIGYCQSLNFIAGLLLLFLKQDKEKVFILLSIITQNHLPGAHARSLANTEVNVLMMLIKDYLPKVWASINDTDLINTGAGSYAHPNSKFQRQPTVALSCTSWFMSIFVGVLPIETVLRVWDAFLYEGPRALYRYALAIFKLGEPEIKKYRPGDGEIFMAVQTLPRRCLDPNILHDLAFVKKGFGNLSQQVIDQKRMFWREQNIMAHQTSVKNSTGRRQLTTQIEEEEDGDRDSLRKAMGMNGLRRRASRKFRKMGMK